MRWNRCFICGSTRDCEHREDELREWRKHERIEERRLERAIEWQRIAGEKEPEPERPTVQ
jgi:hypothetical protein